MQIRVEFYGVPRLRAAVADAVLCIDLPVVTLEDVLGKLAEKFPGLADECFEAPDGSWRLRTAYAVNLDGERFVSAPSTRLSDGQLLLLLAADAGG